jgi:hypothetical protein
MKTKKRTPCKRTQKRRGKKQSNNSCKKHRGGTKLTANDLAKIAYIRSIGILQENYPDDSLRRVLSKYDLSQVEDMDAEAVKYKYMVWRQKEANTRKINRDAKKNDKRDPKLGKKSPSDKKRKRSPDNIPYNDAVDAAVDAAVAAGEVHDMETGFEEFSVPMSPSKTPFVLEGKQLPGFTFSPGRKRKTPIRIDPSNPQDLFNELNHEIDDDFLPDLNDDEIV